MEWEDLQGVAVNWMPIFKELVAAIKEGDPITPKDLTNLTYCPQYMFAIFGSTPRGGDLEKLCFDQVMAALKKTPVVITSNEFKTSDTYNFKSVLLCTDTAQVLFVFVVNNLPIL